MEWILSRAFFPQQKWVQTLILLSHNKKTISKLLGLLCCTRFWGLNTSQPQCIICTLIICKGIFPFTHSILSILAFCCVTSWNLTETQMHYDNATPKPVDPYSIDVFISGCDIERSEATLKRRWWSYHSCLWLLAKQTSQINDCKYLRCSLR